MSVPPQKSKHILIHSNTRQIDIIEQTLQYWLRWKLRFLKLLFDEFQFSMLIMGFICLLGKWPNATSPGKQHKVINMSTTTTFRNSSLKKEVFMFFLSLTCVFQWVYWYYICPSRHLGTTRKRRKWNGANQRNQIGLSLNISYTKCVCYVGRGMLV